MRFLRRFFLISAPAYLWACTQTSLAQTGGITSSDPTRLPGQAVGGGEVATLQEQLEFGLKARRPVEFKFIDGIIKLVEERKLPVQMVVETFDYARRKPTHQFQYFQRAIVIRARRLGLIIRLV